MKQTVFTLLVHPHHREALLQTYRHTVKDIHTHTYSLILTYYTLRAHTSIYCGHTHTHTWDEKAQDCVFNTSTINKALASRVHTHTRTDTHAHTYTHTYIHPTSLKLSECVTQHVDTWTRIKSCSRLHPVTSLWLTPLLPFSLHLPGTKTKGEETVWQTALSFSSFTTHPEQLYYNADTHLSSPRALSHTYSSPHSLCVHTVPLNSNCGSLSQAERLRCDLWSHPAWQTSLWGWKEWREGSWERWRRVCCDTLTRFRWAGELII